ncbi:hypothetical protein Scep_001491 [Stephania cephalantha]|uniref:Uncharacterized protein n=1 Tax=Stephania cephalantha TaxID=152367 RepID=A0AAP0Q3U0_9MAGN
MTSLPNEAVSEKEKNDVSVSQLVSLVFQFRWWIWGRIVKSLPNSHQHLKIIQITLKVQGGAK